MATVQDGRLAFRLRAVAILDIVGYSTLMEVDEIDTDARVTRLFDEVVAPLVANFGGRVVNRLGDGLLLAFESSLDAVSCVIDVQRVLALAGDVKDGQDPLMLRIGVNVGDIIIDGDRIAGDGVNVAARLQTLAAPGEICISAGVRDHLRGDFQATIVDIGEVWLKNIARPIRAYRLTPKESTSAPLRERWVRLRNFNLRLFRRRILVLPLSIVLLGAPAWLVLRSTPTITIPPPMSISVLPFKVAQSDLDQSSAQRVAEYMRRGLAATSWVNVSARHVPNEAAPDDVNVISAGQQLNVRYLLSGSLERSNERLGIDLQLVDTQTGLSSWAMRVEPQAIASSELELAQRATVLLRDAIYDAELKRMIRSGVGPQTPTEYKMMGDLATDPRFVTLPSDRVARSYYEKSIKLDPNYVNGMISLGYTLVTELELNPTVDHDVIVQRLDDLSKRIVTHEPSNAPGWQFRAEVLGREWQWDAALDASDTAISLDPGRAYAFAQRANLLTLVGKPAEAITLIEHALTLAEQRFGYASLQRCRAEMALGNYRAASVSCQKSLSREEGWQQHAYLTAAYALLNEGQYAEHEKITLLRLCPNLTIARISGLRWSNVPAFDHQIQDNLYAGLSRAGIPAK